jgi:moderate conductance mechanosensitive channel
VKEVSQMMALTAAIAWSDVGWERWARVALIVLVVAIGLWLLRRAMTPALTRMVSAQMRDQPQVEVEKRVKTLTEVLYRTTITVVVVVGVLTVLPEFGVNINALLAGSSLIALAIGFGAQSLVKDVIGGLFILVENQYGAGDVVNIAGVGGLVEDISLRRTLLRDLDGATHSVPNGQIGVASNLTRSWARANFLVSVSYEDDVDRVLKVINQVGQEMKEDAAWSADLLEAPSALGIENLGDSGVDIRVLGVTKPIRQWDVMRELRRRIKLAFDREGIEIPYPHRQLVVPPEQRRAESGRS